MPIADFFKRDQPEKLLVPNGTRAPAKSIAPAPQAPKPVFSQTPSPAAGFALVPPIQQVVPSVVPEIVIPDSKNSNAPIAGTPHAPSLRVVAASPVEQSRNTEPDLSDHYSVFADLPRYTAILTAGDDAVLRLTAQQRQSFVVLELTGRKAQVIATNSRAVDLTVLESLRGTLRTDRYNLLPLKYAPDEVIAEIYSGTVSAVSANNVRSGNQYMDAAREWVQYALDNDATDIHLSTRGSAGEVRFRIHGEIESMDSQTQGQYPSSFVEKVMGILYNSGQQRKSSAGGQFEADKNLYCMVPFTDIPGHSLKLRYQSIRGNEGPKVVLRLLHTNESQPTKQFGELGYADSHTELLNTAMNTPSGAVLIAGITGSGKSTTQKSFIELNPNAPSSAIYTIEDPVEYPIKFAHQVPIQRDLSNPEAAAKTYSDTIAALVRLDPDIAMLGEIRDQPSAMALQQMVETGHMGLGTVHAHLLSGIIPRLINREIGMSRESWTSPNMITLFCYQALAPVICTNCAMTSKEAASENSEITKIIAFTKELGLPTHQLRWKRVGGCEHCKHRGTTGLTVVAEMIMPDEDWLRAIRDGKDLDAAAIYRSTSDGDLLSPDMTGKTAFEHTLFKALNGAVDARQCSRFGVWTRFMRQQKAAA